MDIKETFLKLTSRTYPHGCEEELYSILPDYFRKDEFGNIYTIIGDNPSCLFTSHLDTATSANTEIKHVFDENFIKTDGKSILGADDKAGVVVMLYMIENQVPGIYYFFIGEEVGCIGSKKVAEKHKLKKIESVNKVISFDRRGTDSVITHQTLGRCCSDEFAEELANQLNSSIEGFKYTKDTNGMSTDSAQFIKIYPECTNISVGYYSEHTFLEKQDLKHLENLCKAVVKIDWEKLPVKRDPAVFEAKPYRYNSNYYDDYADYYGGCYNRNYNSGGAYNRPNTNVSAYSSVNETVYYNEKIEPSGVFYGKVVRNRNTKELVSLELRADRLRREEILIFELLHDLKILYSDFKWDGMKLIVYYKEQGGSHVTEATREQIAQFIPELDFWKKTTNR